MIKAIFFDIGGVLLDTGLLARRFVKVFRPRDAKNFWHELNLRVIPLCKNQISEAQFCTQMADSEGIPRGKVPKNLWTNDFKKLVIINKKVLRIANQLRQNYKVGIISNTMGPHVKIMGKMGLFDYFDAAIFSNEVGMTKDSRDIFLLAAKSINVKPRGCIFVDDIPEFVNVAKSAGMKGILYKNPEKLESELKRLLNSGKWVSQNGI